MLTGDSGSGYAEHRQYEDFLMATLSILTVWILAFVIAAFGVWMVREVRAMVDGSMARRTSSEYTPLLWIFAVALCVPLAPTAATGGEAISLILMPIAALL